MGDFGLLLTLFTFLKSEVGGRKSKEEILAALDKQETILQYLEWLRRKNHEDLISEIETSKSQLVDELCELRGQFDVVAKRVLHQAGDLKAIISILNQRIGEGWDDACERRRIVFDSAVAQLKNRADISTALSASF